MQHLADAEHTRKARIPFVRVEIPFSSALLLPSLAFAQKKLRRKKGVLQSTQEISGSMGITAAPSPKCFN